jgi:hypothetical protein
MRVAKEAMISEFGQTPSQLFDDAQPHPPRQCITPALTQLLPGYCGTPSSGEEVSQSLVHILLEVAKSENVQSVLASPGKLQPVGSPRRARDAPPDGRCRLSSCPEGMPPAAHESAGNIQHPQRPWSAGAPPTAHSPLSKTVVGSLQRVRKNPVHGAFRMGALLSSLSHSNGAQHAPLRAASCGRSAGSESSCLPCKPGAVDDVLPEAGPVDDSEGDCPTIEVPSGLAPFDAHVELVAEDAAVALGRLEGGLGVAGVSEEAAPAAVVGESVRTASSGAGAKQTARPAAMGVNTVERDENRTEGEEASREEGLESVLSVWGSDTPSDGEPRFWPARLHERLQVLVALALSLSESMSSLPASAAASAAMGRDLSAITRDACLCLGTCIQAWRSARLLSVHVDLGCANQQ